MKKALIAIIAVLLITVLGIGGFFIWRLSKKIDEQNNHISTLINEVKDNKEKENKVENELSNNTINNTIDNTINNNNNNTNTINNNTISNNTGTISGTTTTPVATSDEAKVKEAYITLLKQTYPNYKEYRIDSVKVLTDAEKQELVNTLGGDLYRMTDILAIVTYSLKPDSIENYVLAGNGEIVGEWVVNKSACVAYRDGKIVADGTGW